MALAKVNEKSRKSFRSLVISLYRDAELAQGMKAVDLQAYEVFVLVSTLHSAPLCSI